ncbi:MAG: FAD-dependent oxidoreductase [Candidatus Sumerlaeaceae bacterium]|nr:FAD-dependent oxidoreductase [Candidatus Sumerlaeaceae bacterium]
MATRASSSFTNIGKSVDVVVIGGGHSGCAAALQCARNGASVALLEMRDGGLGGAYLHETTIPARVYLRSAEIALMARRAGEFAVDVGGEPRIELGGLLRKKQAAVTSIESNMRNSLKKAGVHIAMARGYLAGPERVALLDPESGDDIMTVSAKNIIIASGSRAVAPFGMKPDGARVLIPEQLYSIRNAPKSAIILGNDTTSCEAATLLSALGSSVTIVTEADGLLPEVDEEVAMFLSLEFQKRGINTLFAAQIRSTELGSAGVKANITVGGKQESLSAEIAVACVARQPATDHLGLRKLGIETAYDSSIKVDDHMRTSKARVFAIGECTDPAMLSEEAYAQGEYVAAVIQGDPGRRPAAHDFPRVVETDPPVASLGLTREQARNAQIPITIGRRSLKFNSHAIARGETSGFITLLCEQATGEILGAHIAGPHAAELIGAVALAKKFEYSVTDFAQGFVTGPSLAEAVVEAAQDAVGQHSLDQNG